MFQLKTYQSETLQTLRTYLETARYDGAEAAFKTLVETQGRRVPPYTPVEGLEDVPYVCLRLPTGGGKTLLSAHAIAIAAQAYLEREFPLVLLLVPTNTIRLQTYETFTKPGHPNREALWQAFDGRLRVLDIADFTQLRPQDLREKTCIVIGTLQTLRVTNKDGRKVYAHNEHLEPHFSRVPDNTPGLHRIEDGPEAGKLKYSFANLLALSRPLVLVDEAHNATTSLSFDVLRDIRPACILEFTATPASNSNVLHNVSAAELKAEEMIKLPIVLTEHQTWQQAVQDAILTRAKLAEKAALEREFIRPIVLFQAESKDKDVTVKVLEDYLVNECKIKRERLAIATGDQRELDGVDLLDPLNQVEFVITVEALKEGWDCPFAYVFCSVANVHSARSVEQILGRVLRMPYARLRQQAELNRAYAHVASTSWPQAVGQLKDKLVSMGFEEQETDTYIDVQPRLLPDAPHQIAEVPLRLYFTEMPELKLNLFEENQIKFIPAEDAHPEHPAVIVQVSGPISEELEAKLVLAVPKEDRPALKATLVHHRRTQRPPTPSEKQTPFRVPQLALFVDGAWELAEEEWFLDEQGWSPLDFPAQLTEGEFTIREEANSFSIDIQGKRLVERFLGQQSALDFGDAPTEWTDLQLSRWLDGRLYQPDIRQEVMLEFVRRTVTALLQQRHLSLAQLLRVRYPLEKALREKIKAYRAQAYQNGYQQSLFAPQAKVETSLAFDFTFDPINYPAHWWYTGSFQFNKHYYPTVGELKADGEEFDCAQALDRQPIKHWVRNLEKQPTFSFRLPLANGWFYPDFVAQLRDGRILVVEYKGGHLAENPDELQKKNVGELWEEKSGGTCLFLWAVKKDATGRDVYGQLERKISI